MAKLAAGLFWRSNIIPGLKQRRGGPDNLTVPVNPETEDCQTQCADLQISLFNFLGQTMVMVSPEAEGNVGEHLWTKPF